jgi:hypothetical protein
MALERSDAMELDELIRELTPAPDEHLMRAPKAPPKASMLLAMAKVVKAQNARIGKLENLLLVSKPISASEFPQPWLVHPPVAGDSVTFTLNAPVLPCKPTMTRNEMREGGSCKNTDAIAMCPSKSSGVMHRMASFVVTEELLCQVLHLPPGTRIVAAARTPLGCGDVRLTVEHADLKEIAEGDCVPKCDPKWVNHESISFGGWGQS